MKKRAVLPLIAVLSFLMVFTGNTMACPYMLNVLLDSTSVTYNYNGSEVSPVTVQGSIEFDPSSYVGGPVNLQIIMPASTHWSTITKIDGNIVHDGDIIVLNKDQKLSLEVIVVPISNEVDTEIYDITFKYGSKCYVGGQRLSLITKKTIDPTAAVTFDLQTPTVTISPNPAGSYISAHGLNDMQAGYQYEIFSISGVEVRQGMLPADARINVQDLPSGAYRLLLFDAKRTLTTKAFTVLH